MTSNGSLPSPPFVDIQGIPNFRDIGGYATTASLKDLHDKPASSVRRGFVYRCADPGRVTEVGKQKLRALGVKKFFDLRSKPELAKLENGPVEIDGIERVFSPAFVEEDYSPEGVAKRYKEYTTSPDGFIAAYKEILRAAAAPKPNHKPAYPTIFRHILEHPDEPFVIHCTAGKDRTGVLAALLLSLASVQPETVTSEYSLTDQGLAELKPIFIERLLKNPALEGNRKGVETMCGSHPDSMRGTLAMIDKEYGSAEGYLINACGFTQDEVDVIKKTLVSNESPIL